jgi:hypothetical protein
MACTFSVVAAASRPVPGAAVLVVDTAWTPMATGRTDSNGEWRAAIGAGSARTPLSALVSADGFGRQRADLPDPLPARYEVRLERAAAITGWVTLGDGRPAPAGTRVFAWETLTAPPAAAFRHGQDDAAALVACSVEADGRFALGGVSPSRRYHLGAGRPGWTTVELADDVAPDSAPVALQLWRLYGCVVRAAFPGGGPAPPSRLGSLYPHAPKEARWIEVEYPSIQLSLAGIHHVEGVRRHGILFDWRNLLLVYAASHEAAALHGMRLVYRIPGVETTEVSTDIPAIDGSIGERCATLRPTALGFGTLRLELSGGAAIAPSPGSGDDNAGASGDSPPWDTWTDAAHVEIVSQSSAAGYRVSLPALRPGTSEIDGVPFGVYRVRLVLKGGGAYPGPAGATMQIGHEPAVLAVSLDELGSVRLRPEDYDATRRHLGITVHVAPEGGTASATYSLTGPPYLVQGLKPGRYDLQLEAWSRGHGRDQASVSALVLRGQMSEVRFSWTR